MRFSPIPNEAKYLEPLGVNSDKYFKKVFPEAMSLHNWNGRKFESGYAIYFLTRYYWDKTSGVINKVLVIYNLGINIIELNHIAQFKFSKDMMANTYIKGQIQLNEMVLSPKLFIYTNELFGNEKIIKDIFKKFTNDYIEIIEEKKLHKTLFISYGGPDEEMVKIINDKLKQRGVTTWFFPEDSIPGDKLHRIMSDGVNNYDRVLLVCSENSLVRNGVLNEIERLLERESSEAGSDIMIPITLDDYVFKSWQPQRDDIKRQVLSRNIIKIHEDNIDESIEKITKALLH